MRRWENRRQTQVMSPSELCAKQTQISACVQAPPFAQAVMRVLIVTTWLGGGMLLGPQTLMSKEGGTGWVSGCTNWKSWKKSCDTQVHRFWTKNKTHRKPSAPTVQHNCNNVQGCMQLASCVKLCPSQVFNWQCASSLQCPRVPPERATKKKTLGN